jgi:DNA polymerase-1
MKEKLEFKQMEKKKNNVFVVIDSNAVIHRAFHALPPLKKENGEVVNAVYGFLLVLFKILKELNPECLAACFDLPEPTFRKQAFEQYKAKRKKAPDELYAQIPMVKDVLKVFNVPIFEYAGYEADDVIGTLTNSKTPGAAKNAGNIIVSGDLDTLQLVDKNTKVYFLARGVKETVFYDEEKTRERFDGLSPNQIIDFKALRGDASDNIPGVKGIGEKTAIELLKQYGNLENIYKEAEKANSKIKESVKEKLNSDKKNAFLSYDLGKIDRNVPLKIDMSAACWGGYDEKKVLHLLAEFGFKSLMNKLPGAEQKSSPLPKKKIGVNLKLW